MKHGLLNSPGERDLIARIRARVPAAPAWLTVVIGDDAAVAQPERGALEILTTDALVEDVHFRLDWITHRELGFRAAAVNLSDLAASGAEQDALLVTLAAPGFASAAVTAPGDIISFPSRDFVSATGYDLTNLFTVEVQHPDGSVVGTVTDATPFSR